MKRFKLAKIRCEIYHELTSAVTQALAELGITGFYTQQARSILLRERRRSIFTGAELIEDVATIFRFNVPLASEQVVMCRLIQAAALDCEGNGSIYSQHIESIEPDTSSPPGAVNCDPPPPAFPMIQKLTGITCIVPRGQGNLVARTAAEMGMAPIVTFGIGAGLRDRLGLIRITIPAGKEIVSLVAPQHDAPGAIHRLVEAGKLDHPGRGVVFAYPVANGMLNTRIYVSRHTYAATPGQIVAAIDEIKGSTSWRKKFNSMNQRSAGNERRNFRHDQVALTLLCREGQAQPLVRAALEAGVGGATISPLRQTAPANPAAKWSPAREQCIMILPAPALDTTLQILDNAGLFSPAVQARIILRPCTNFYAYVDKSSTPPAFPRQAPA